MHNEFSFQGGPIPTQEKLNSSTRTLGKSQLSMTKDTYDLNHAKLWNEIWYFLETVCHRNIDFHL